MVGVPERGREETKKKKKRRKRWNKIHSKVQLCFKKKSKQMIMRLESSLSLQSFFVFNSVFIRSQNIRDEKSPRNESARNPVLLHLGLLRLLYREHVSIKVV